MVKCKLCKLHHRDMSKLGMLLGIDSNSNKFQKDMKYNIEGSQNK